MQRPAHCSVAADVQLLCKVVASFGCQVGTWPLYEDVGKTSANSTPYFDYEVDIVGKFVFEWWILGFVGWVVPQFPAFIHYALCFNFCSLTLALWSGRFGCWKARKKKKRRRFLEKGVLLGTKEKAPKQKGLSLCRKVGRTRVKSPRGVRCRKYGGQKKNRWVAVWATARGLALQKKAPSESGREVCAKKQTWLRQTPKHKQMETVESPLDLSFMLWLAEQRQPTASVRKPSC